MTLRGRVAALVAGVVAVAVLAVGLAAQALVVRRIFVAVDRDLRAVAADVERRPREALMRMLPRRDRFGGAAAVIQVVDAAGRVLRLPGAEDGAPLPVTTDVRAVAAGTAPGFLRTVEVEGRAVRILVVPATDGLALQVARPLDEADRIVRDLRRTIALVSVLAAAVAAALARWLAGRSVRPVTDLTARVESVRGAGDLGIRLEVRGADEVGRLAAAFNGMLARLEAARDAQERLTADASHELRTPLTSLRTNLEVLALAEAGDAMLDPVERGRLLADVRGQVAELAAMVDGLVAIARDGGPGGAREDVDPVALATDVVGTARRRHPQRAADLTLVVGGDGGTTVTAERSRIAAALTNLLDNAVKYAPDGPIAVAVVATADEVRLVVRDHGPGVAEDELPHLFDRFYRAPGARSAPGAGLGLALVAQVARDHGGRAAVRRPDDGGLEVLLALPRR